MTHTGLTPKSAMRSVATSGIQQLRHERPAVRANVKTGAAMSATTAGRSPMKIWRTAALSPKVRNAEASSKMMSTGMATLPVTAANTPRTPRRREPTAVAILTAKTPGMACATAMSPKKSSRDSHPRRSTSSRSINGIMAYPPPMVKVPILKNDTNSARSDTIKKWVTVLYILTYKCTHYYLFLVSLQTKRKNKNMRTNLKIFVVLAMMLCIGGGVQAQNILRNLGERAAERAKNRVEQKTEEKVDNTVDNAVDNALGSIFGRKKKSEQKTEEQAQQEDAEEIETQAADTKTTTQPKKKAQAEEVKSDFVPGTVVIFEDDFASEQMGEFPSKWDLLSHNAEVARINGKKAIKFEHGSETRVTPLLKDGNRKYLPEVYTLEFDFFVTDEEDHNSAYRLYLSTESENQYSTINFGSGNMNWSIEKPNSDDYVQGNTNPTINQGEWNHFALSFNKRALKVYINNRRIINIPNAKAMDWFSIETDFWEDHLDYITNVRLAKGAVELYERNAQDMSPIEKAIAETGRFVTNNILFETSKADIKAESMDEIRKVADYMKKNPAARFEVQGHTDNQGSDKINDPLSQRRAEAIVNALVQMGCDEFNLRAVGKGSHEPVADNKTEAGRAQNRRVVFVKK